ncbi:clotting factor G beta subunit-like isoform X4 [Diabrotica virgifera virgifera]|uniref:Peptidase S1 domain-containing protein n=1 Tax=Diabrotica virgifera virgifera TaxID=50390 RepID=A0ABM5JRB3_DIAVI|nr:clotting factor G beta subunit-like isoform X1 [Diabrotica virgifera virgifera]XP_050500475.1 clotting factor G beta subunit-like isoform X2 [Diabrotica virgifera virgifera]XP_050500476.1 clotting factor G beta subunit-like isoform X3 [Diabrotica virgifera virgifera]XP_050500477.1 clotting factor G beta subunit-like isoform X4 [Diabrotica virgifera virgifera]
MKSINLLICVLFVYLNIAEGISEDSSSAAVANEICKSYTEDAKKNHICPVPQETRLIGGILAEKGEFPHMVQLAYSKRNTTEYLCSGFIISKNYVLTAAHCVNGGGGTNKPHYLRAGVTDVNDVSNEQVRSIDSIIIHPEFKRPPIYHDIALIKVTEDFNFNKFVSPICLYTNNENPDGEGVHPGWGPTGDDFALEKQPHMIRLSLNFDSNESCNSTFFRIAKSVLPEGIAKNKIVCAGGKTGGCQIDSGSPLQIYRKDGKEKPCMYDAVGISSFGVKVCGKEVFPTAFTRISHYIKWIQVNVWPQLQAL